MYSSGFFIHIHGYNNVDSRWIMVLAQFLNTNRTVLCYNTWKRHQMEAFSALLPICAGNSPVTSELPAQRSVTRSFDVFFDVHLNKRLSIKSWGWWFVTPPRPLWRHCNECWYLHTLKTASRYDTYFVVTCGTGSCHNDNTRCQQWRHIWNHANFESSLYTP